MGKLPNFDKAVIPIEKLEDYVLNPNHQDGQHKARVFKACLGFEQRHAAAFAEVLQNGLKRAPAQLRENKPYGEIWTTWHEVIGLNGKSAIVTAGWMLKKNPPEPPTLMSCYIETRKQERLRELLASAAKDFS